MSESGKSILALLCWAVLSLLVTLELEASDNVVIPDDRNSRLTVGNVVVKEQEDILFFVTWPYLGDPLSGQECALNFYTLTLKPGLLSLQARPVGKGVCSGLLQKSRLLDNGDVLLVTGKRFQRWRNGEEAERTAFTEVKNIGSLGGLIELYDPAAFAISPEGHIATAVAVADPGKASGDGGHAFKAVVISPERSLQWSSPVSTGGFATLGKVVVTADGSALFQFGNSVHVFDSAGRETKLLLGDESGEIDPQQMGNLSPAEMQAYFQRMAVSNPAELTRLSAHPAGNSSFYVLYERKGGASSEEGITLANVSASGAVLSRISLGKSLRDLQLENWVDFRVRENTLILLGRVLATQPGVEARRDRYMQNVVSLVDLETRDIRSRLIPLDMRYLEAAMNAGDAEIKDLPGLPGGEPVLLSLLNGIPLDVTVGTVAKRQVLRVSEAAENLLAWSPGADRKLRDEQKAQNQPTAADQATQMQQYMQSMSDGSYMEQMIAELQKQLDSDPNMPPQLRAQLEQSIRQMRDQSGNR